MKLLTTTRNRADLEGIKVLLESRGIHVFIGNEASMSYTPIMEVYEIWVVVEEQFEDAQKVLEDENYEVKNLVDLNEYKNTAELEVKAQLTKYVDKLMNVVMVIFFIILVIYFLDKFEIL